MEGFKTEQSIFDDVIVRVGVQLSNLLTEYKKQQLLIEQDFFQKKNQIFLWLHLAGKHYTDS